MVLKVELWKLTFESAHPTTNHNLRVIGCGYIWTSAELPALVSHVPVELASRQIGLEERSIGLLKVLY